MRPRFSTDNWYQTKHLAPVSGLFQLAPRSGLARHVPCPIPGRMRSQSSKPSGDQSYETLLQLWAQEGSLGRAADRYATMTGDCEFAVQAMLADQLERPMPGLWLALPVSLTEDPKVQRQLIKEIGTQRRAIQQAKGRVFTTISDLYETAIRRVVAVGDRPESSLTDLLVAEACCGDLLLVARLLVEQQAMLEARHHFGDSRAPDRALVRALRYAGDAVLFELDPKLQSGVPLDEVLGPEIVLESLNDMPIEPRPAPTDEGGRASH